MRLWRPNEILRVKLHAKDAKLISCQKDILV